MVFLEINSLKLNNIKCFDEIEINFDKGANIITGANGTGKSTILTGIGYGLFGSQYISVNIADLIKRGEEYGRIELHFSTDRGKYKSIHYLNISKSNSWKVYKYGISTPLTETITESQEYIQNLLGRNIDHTVYKNAVASEQGKITGIIDLRPSSRKDQIRKILGLDYFDIASTHLGKFSKELERKEEDLEKRIEILDHARDDPKILEEKLEQFENQLDQKTNKMEELEAEKTDLENNVTKLNELKNSISVKSLSLKSNREEKVRLHQKIEANQDDVRTLFSEINEKQTSIDLVQMRNEEDTNNIKKLRVKKEELQSNLQTYNNLNKRLTELETEIKQYQDNSQQVTKRYEELIKQYPRDQLETKIESINSSIKYGKEQQENLRKQIAVIQEREQKLEGEENQIREHIADLEEAIQSDLQTDLEGLEQVKIINQENIQKITDIVEGLDEKIKEANSELSKTKQQIEVTNQTILLLQQTDKSAKCPTCQRDFEDIDTEGLLSHHEDILAVHSKSLEQYKQNRQRLEENRTKFQEKLTEFKEREKKVAILETRATHLPDWKSSLENIYKEQEKIAKDKDQINQELEKLKELNTDELKTERDRWKGIIEEMTKFKTEMTSTNRVLKIRSDEKTQVEQKINEINPSELRQIHTENQEKLEMVEKRLEVRRDRLLPKLRDVKQSTERYEQLNKEITQLEQDLAQLNSLFDENDLQQKDRALKSLTEQYGSVKSEITTLKSTQIPDLKQRLEKARQNEKQLIQLQNTYQEYHSMLPVVNQVRDIIDRVPTRIIEKISSNLSARLTQTIQRLLPNRGYNRVVFHPNGEINLFNNGHIVEHSTLSGGERTVLGLAFRLALADYVAPLQFLILDEPTNHLDRERVREFVEIVDRENIFQSTTGQLLLVTHRQEFDRNAQNSIRLTIDNGIRKLVDQ